MNILLIVSDQHRRDWLGCSLSPGAALVRTPNLDALAARGVLFESAYCPYPLCGPSRMALMTGRRASRIGMFVNEHTLRSDVPTFAHALGRAGYETVLCGRMHFSGIDQRHGFERRLVGDVNSSYGGGPDRERNTARWESSHSARAASVARAGWADTVNYDVAVAEAATRFLDQRRVRGEKRPLLMVAGFFQPHHPFVAPPDHFEAALSRLQALDDCPRAGAHPHPWLEGIRGAGDGLHFEQILRARAAYAGMIDHLDGLLGRVMDAAARSLEGPTLVVYTSDHGEMAGDRNLWGKTVLYEASAGVPLIFAPLESGQRLGGLGLAVDRRCREPVSLLDLAPTLSAVAGAPGLPDSDGRDLSPLLHHPDGRDWAAQPPVMAECCIRFPGPDGRLAVDDPASAMIRIGDWKLVYYHPEGRAWANRCTLHNLRLDPWESFDRASDPSCTETRELLLQQLLSRWDPDSVGREASARAHDLAYTTAWGRAVGQRVLGPLECWHPGRREWDFGLPGTEWVPSKGAHG